MTKNKKGFSALLLSSFILLSFYTESFARPGDPPSQYGCGRNTVSLGDPIERVRDYCGSPTSVQTTSDGSNSDKTGNEVWTYNFGQRGGLVKFTFRDGVLGSIRSY